MSRIILSQMFEELVVVHVEATGIPTSKSERISDTDYETMFVSSVLRAILGGGSLDIPAW